MKLAILLLLLVVSASAQTLLPQPPTPSWKPGSASYNWWQFALQEKRLKLEALAEVATLTEANAALATTSGALTQLLADTSKAMLEIRAELAAIKASLSEPTAPRALVATIVQWKDNSADEAGFRVERSSDDGATWKIVATLGSNATGWVDFTEQPARYSYRVRAYNGTVVSEPSNISVKTLH